MLDEAWVASHLRPRFSRVLARPGIYLANHSLGRPPDRAAADVAAALDHWYTKLGGAWEPWIEARDKHRALTAKLIGAPRPDCVVPKTSAGQGLRAVLNALPGKPRVLTSDAEFDSIDFILRVYRDKGRIELKALPFDQFSYQPCDLVVLSSVAFRSGSIFPDLRQLIERCHSAGALVLLDVYHHAGALPLDLTALDADFAIGGSYKYLRGGPGACWLYVHPRHHGMVTLDTGWFAKKDVFAYERPDPPQFAAGGDAWLESTPPVLSPLQALSGLEVVLELGVENLRRHNLAQKYRLTNLMRREGLKPEADGAGFGAFITLQHPRAMALEGELKKAGVECDARGDVLRFCPDVLTTDAELVDAAGIVARTLK